MHDVLEVQPLSWRDPDGFVVRASGRILRAVSRDKAEQTRELLRSPWIVQLIRDGLVPPTSETNVALPQFENMEGWLWLEHEPLAFPCYPHEITALQLYDSAVLTLDIAINAAQRGWVLKDASAWNVLHSRGRGVFVDLLSFEKRGSGTSWIAYGQFVRHFLLPLMLHRKCGFLPPDIFLTQRDGITPERVYEMLKGLDLVSAAALEFVVLPKWLALAGSRLIEAHSSGAPQKRRVPIAGQDSLLNTLTRLRRVLMKLRPDLTGVKSVWKSYEEERAHYSEQDLAAKKEFVRKNIQAATTVLDLGCNAGEFSQLAAECGKSVVAADSDHPALTRLYQRIRGQRVQISPVFLNIGRPTPSVGWMNNEVPSFIDRAHGQFDCILVLGLIHHLLVGERATLSMLADMLDQLNPKLVIIEWVDPSDPKFRQVAGLNASLYSALDMARFEQSMLPKFTLVSKMHLPCGTRVMYLWSR